MSNKLANASTLGYAGFAVTLWMVSMINAGWFNPSQQTLDIMLAAVLGGTVMGLAGMMEFSRGRTVDMLQFMAFAAFWWTWTLNAHAVANGAAATTSGFMGWFFLLWAVVAFYLWIASFHAGTGRMLFDLGLWLTMLALAIAGWSNAEGFRILGGYLGLITALIGGYVSAGELLNESYGHTILPVGGMHHDDAQVATPDVRHGMHA